MLIRDGWPITQPTIIYPEKVFLLPFYLFISSNSNFQNPADIRKGGVISEDLKKIYYNDDGTIEQEIEEKRIFDEWGRMISYRWESDSIWFITKWEYDDLGRVLISNTIREDTKEIIKVERYVYDLANSIAIVYNKNDQIERIVIENMVDGKYIYEVFRKKKLVANCIVILDSIDRIIQIDKTETMGASSVRSLLLWDFQNNELISFKWISKKDGRTVVDAYFQYENEKIRTSSSSNGTLIKYSDIDIGGNWCRAERFENCKKASEYSRTLQYR